MMKNLGQVLLQNDTACAVFVPTALLRGVLFCHKQDPGD
jgi:hypothetical protein